MLQWFSDQPFICAVHNMLEGGVSVSEPFVHGMLVSVRNRLLHELRTKTRVQVPNSVLHVGVVDDYGVLQSGQVFVQYKDKVCASKMSLSPSSLKRLCLAGVSVQSGPG